MFRKSARLNSLMARNRQHGFLMPLAVFIVVGLAFLALAISRISSQATESSFLEGVSIQAFYAAESGAQFGMNQLLFDVTTRAAATTNCTALSGGTTITFNLVPGLEVCSTNVSCPLSSEPGYFVIRSDANCGSGAVYAERSIEASAFF